MMHNETPTEMEMDIAGVLMKGYSEGDTAKTLGQPPNVVADIAWEIHTDECWRTPRIDLLCGVTS